MDSIPDEVLQRILNFAMIRRAPFCAEICFRAAELLERQNKTDQHDDAEKPERQSRSLEPKMSTNQRSHLLDWCAVVGTSRRFRRMGKFSFFSQKVFAMGPRLASKLQNLQVTCLSVEDQQLAVNYMSSIIWTENSITSPSSFLTLSRRISAFPRLKRLDHVFGYRDGDPDHFILCAAKDRRQAWSHLIDILALIGMSVERLDVGIMSTSDTTWSYIESGLKCNIYPTLRTAASMKAKYVRKQT